MRANMGNIDRVLRAIVGTLLISLLFIGPQAHCVRIGVVPLLTAFVTWCPAYVPFGISTCREAQRLEERRYSHVLCLVWLAGKHLSSVRKSRH